jgi:AcrR family transcriptional regulator
LTPRRFATTGPPLTRDEIVQRALAYADEGTLDQVTIRRLADDLGVTPMALYRHVQDKADLLEQVTDVLLARAGLPDRRVGWARCLTELARSLRSVLRDQPVAVSAFARRPQTSPTSLARYDAAMAALGRGGFDQAPATRAYAAVHTYTLGYCALEAARRLGSTGRTTSDTGEDEDDDPRRRAIEGFVTEAQFERGLNALIRGLTPAAGAGQSRGRGSQR